MRERIIGVETEYSLSHIPGAGQQIVRSEQLSEKAVGIARRDFGSKAGDSHFLHNGGKLYYDVGHVEWATPECRSVREALIYGRAGDALMGRTADALERELGFPSAPEAVFAAKNNVDARGSSFGSHENYLVARTTPVIPDANEFFHYLARVLVPFLVSRTILCGSGLVREGFQISQRAGYINSVASTDTRESRPIINTRDEPHADGNRYRRLHLILGDSNLAEWAEFLKLGTTSLVLAMAEDVYLSSIPELLAPVTALWSISKDPSLRAAVPLSSGKTATAIEIQKWYLDQARTYFAHPDREEGEILDKWSQVLSELARDQRLAIGKLDWVTKKDLLERQLLPESGSGGDNIRAFDFRYHSLRTGSSVYRYLIAAGLMERIVEDEEVENALKEPPPFTRARMRGAAIRFGSCSSDWCDIDIKGAGSARIDDPFDWARVDTLLLVGMPPGEVFDWLSNACSHGPVGVKVQALIRLSDLAGHATFSLRGQICGRISEAIADTDQRVRLASVRAMSAVGSQSFREPLRQAAQDNDYQVRFAAESALSGGW